jgi:hypothetical protein
MKFCTIILVGVILGWVQVGAVGGDEPKMLGLLNLPASQKESISSLLLREWRLEWNSPDRDDWEACLEIEPSVDRDSMHISIRSERKLKNDTSTNDAFELKFWGCCYKHGNEMLVCVRQMMGRSDALLENQFYLPIYLVFRVSVSEDKLSVYLPNRDSLQKLENAAFTGIGQVILPATASNQQIDLRKLQIEWESEPFLVANAAIGAIRGNQRRAEGFGEEAK